jgi:predicted AlkP superfamily phosphohydrolase/phosphomutase/tetratricopeptide (TPR) repeat protein
LLVGWDAADWAMIHPLLDRGEMPNLQRIIDSGVMGNLATMDPPLSPLLWTSIVTGKTADQHGVLGFLEPDPVSGGARPVNSSARRCKAIWNILNQSGLRPHVVNWFASYPAEPLRGVCVSNPVCQASLDIPAGAIHPPELQPVLAQLRLTPRDMSGNELALFVPNLKNINQEKDTRLVTLARVLSEGLTTHSMATWILEHQPWDFVAVYFDTIDHAGHEFMAFHPPQMDSVNEQDFANYQGVMNSVYRMHDLMLGRLCELAGPDATVMILSDHGFQTGSLRPVGSGLIPLEAAMQWHRRHGIFCLAGPGIRQDEVVLGAGLLDITPTILALFGLPLAEDMKGRPLMEAFVEPPVLEKIPSWETVDGETGMHPAEVGEDAWDATAAMEQLAALGYVEAPGPDLIRRREAAVQHQKLNLARVYLATRRPAEAIPLLEELEKEFPGQPGIKMYLGQAYFRTKQYERSNRIGEELIAAEFRNAAHVLRANSAIYQGNEAEALDYLLKAEEAQRPTPELHVLIAQAHLRLRRFGDAEVHFRKALEIDPRSAVAHRGLASVLLIQKRYREAAEVALDSVGLEYSHAGGHYLLGVALLRSGAIGRAIRALESCLAISPLPWAHYWLEQIHTRATGDLERARVHQEAFHALRAAQSAATAVAGD